MATIVTKSRKPVMSHFLLHEKSRSCSVVALKKTCTLVVYESDVLLCLQNLLRKFISL